MGQETVRKWPPLCFTSSQEIENPGFRKFSSSLPSLSRKHRSVLRVLPNLSRCSPDPSRSQRCSFKSLGAKEFENETHRTMGTAKGQGQQPVQLCPGRARHPAWHAGGVGNQISKNSSDPHWSRPPLSEIGQKPRETTTFLTPVLLRYQNQLWPCLRSLCWRQVWT